MPQVRALGLDANPSTSSGQALGSQHRRLAGVGSRHSERTKTVPADATLPFRHVQLFPQAAELPVFFRTLEIEVSCRSLSG